MLSTGKLNRAIAEFLDCDAIVADIYISILSTPKEKTELSISYCNLDNLDKYLELLPSFCLIADYSNRDKVHLFYASDPQCFPCFNSYRNVESRYEFAYLQHRRYCGC